MAEPSEAQLRDIRRLFDKLDIRETSHVSAEDINDFLEDLGEEVAGFKIQDMIKEVDLNNNGTIELGELIEMFRRQEAGEKKYELYALVMTVKDRIALGQISK